MDLCDSFVNDSNGFERVSISVVILIGDMSIHIGVGDAIRARTRGADNQAVQEIGCLQ